MNFALSYSRSKKIIIEDYIIKNHPYLIGGDIFVVDGQVKVWGLLNCHRDEKVNSLVPVGKSYPLQLTEEQQAIAKSTLQDLIDKVHFRNGAMNVELMIDKNNRCFLIDVGPRSGGNMIPDLLGMIFDIDIPQLCVKCAMGEKVDISIQDGHPYYATHNLHSDKNGTLRNIEFDKELKKYIVKECLYKKSGDRVKYFDNAAKALGIIFLKFNTEKEMENILNAINSYIKVVLQ
jgi:biotin carboxylase